MHIYGFTSNIYPEPENAYITWHYHTGDVFVTLPVSAKLDVLAPIAVAIDGHFDD